MQKSGVCKHGLKRLDLKIKNGLNLKFKPTEFIFLQISADTSQDYITTYYKGLFHRPEECPFMLDVERTDDIPQVTEENRILVEEFTEEVRKVVFQMEYNKAPMPDGFPVEFYQIF
jgi:hypothetical protein